MALPRVPGPLAGSVGRSSPSMSSPRQGLYDEHRDRMITCLVRGALGSREHLSRTRSRSSRAHRFSEAVREHEGRQW